MMRRIRSLIVFVAFAPAAAVAQTAGQRTVLEAFRDSLARATDSLGLARVEASMVAGMRRNRANPLDHLRLGFLGLRQSELGASRYLEDAAAEFQSVTRLAPSWPYGWYGLGLAEYGLARVDPSALPAAARSPYVRAIAALARAAQLDGRFADLLVEDAYRARRGRQTARVGIMLEALRQAAEPRAANGLILAGLGRLEREFGEPVRALKSFESWLAQSGRARGLALLEVARTRFLLGRVDGVAPYYEGAAADDSTTVRGYRDDLTPIATTNELQEFDRAAGAARVAYLRRFWGKRDAADLRAPGERLREHYRRIYHARRTFPLYLPGRVADVLASTDPPTDDRGLVYIRHGEPDDRVELSVMGMEPNESWRYARSEGDLVLHFVARHDPEVYRLVESLLDVADVTTQPGIEAAAVVTQGQEALLRSREQISPVYRRDRRTTAERGRDFLLAERALSRASLRTALSSDSDRPRFAAALQARADLALFPVDAKAARLHMVFAALFPDRHAVWLGEGVDYPLRLRLAAFTADGEQVAIVDTMVRPVTWTSRGERWLSGTFTTLVPNARLQLRLVLQDGDSVGTVLPLRFFETVTPGPLALSDLAVGVPGDPWRIELMGGEPVALLPVGPLRRQAEAEVAYEVVSSDSVVHVQRTLMRADDDAGVIYSIAHEEPVPGGRRLVRHRLDLDRLKPGLYRLEVTVTDRQGGLVRRARGFEVR